jgi:hypothetical protein
MRRRPRSGLPGEQDKPRGPIQVYQSARIEISALSYFKPGYSQLDTRTSVAPVVPPLTPVSSPVITSVTSIPTPVRRVDASFLANRPNTVLTTHALGAGGLRDECRASNDDARDCEAVENSHLKLL